MKTKVKGFASIVFLILTINLSAQSIEDFAFHIKAGADIPVGGRSSLFNENATWLIGGSLAISGQYIFPDLPLLYMEGNINVGLEPSQAQLLTLGSLGVGGGIDLRIGDTLSWQIGPEAGGTYGLYQSGASAFNPYFGGKTSMILDLNPGFAVTLGGSYRYHIGYDATADEFTDLYQGMSVSVGGVLDLTLNPAGRKFMLQI